MIIPKSVKVCARVIDIEYPHRFQDCVAVNWATFNPTGQKISISDVDQHGNERHSDGVAHSFLHEVLHAIDFLYNNYEISNHEDGERWMDQIAEGLLQVVRDNNLDFR